MKKLARQIVAAILGRQVRRLYKKNNFKVVAIAGSIGKTSTKLAIAHVLKAGFRVRYQYGNYNDLVTVPLVFFGESLPSLFNPFAWLAVFWRNRRQIAKKYPYDFVVIELGSDGPGQIAQFKKYLKIETAVLTSITPEHMEFFGSLDAVAKEELAVTALSNQVIANKDLSPAKYLKGLANLKTYAIQQPANYRLVSKNSKLIIRSGSKDAVVASSKNRSEAEQYSLLAAAVIGLEFGMKTQDIEKGLNAFKPVPGRMQILRGIKGSTIIDDSYNSSPDALKLALSSFYKMPASQRVAILGNMNELGKESAESHAEIGKLCDPKKLDLVVTIGPDANGSLAPAAKTNGCEVKLFDDPYRAGQFVEAFIKSGAAVLVKGSQNGVFAEEAIKFLLADKKEYKRLVRQSDNWLDIKAKQFPGFGWLREKEA